MNFGEADYDAGAATLPQWGFLIEAPKLTAFYATRYRDKQFAKPTFVVRHSP